MVSFATSLFMLAVYLVFSIAYFNLFKKAGIANAWFAFVPLLSTIGFLWVIGKSGWNILWILVPVANIVFFILWNIKFLKAFGKNPWWTLVAIIPYVDIIYSIYLVVIGFSSSTQYYGPRGNGSGSGNGFTY